MMARRINADKSHLWKTDIVASVDQFNQWFMRFAPEAFRSTRVKTTGHVKAALLATRDLRSIDATTPRTIRVRCQLSACVRLRHWPWTA
jgi:type II restriction enzyme